MSGKYTNAWMIIWLYVLYMIWYGGEIGYDIISFDMIHIPWCDIFRFGYHLSVFFSFPCKSMREPSTDHLPGHKIVRSHSLIWSDSTRSLTKKQKRWESGWDSYIKISILWRAWGWDWGVVKGWSPNNITQPQSLAQDQFEHQQWHRHGCIENAW